MNTQNDNRSLMTKKKMADALLLLMKKTPVYQISVQQLTRTADINRSTFYYYYDNIFELLKEIETRFFEELESALDSHMIQKKNDASYPYAAAIFRHIGKHQKFYMLMQGPTGDPHFNQQFKQFLNRKRIINYHIMDSKNWDIFWADKETDSFRNEFLNYGLIGMIDFWLSSGMRQTPEELSRMYAGWFTSVVQFSIHVEIPF